MKILIIGGGPAGNTCATAAARMGAEVVLVEDNLLGGYAHLRECIPSKAMIGLCGRRGESSLEEIKEEVNSITHRLSESLAQMLEHQNVKVIFGKAQIKDRHEVAVETKGGMTFETADVIVLATGSRARIPEWCEADGKRILLTSQVYPPPEIPEHIVIVGSGVTGVEMTHLFSSLGSRVTLLISRQHVLPDRDPEVAAVLEKDFAERGINLLKGARASGVDLDEDTNKDANKDGSLVVRCEDERRIPASHMLLAVGALPNSENLGIDAVDLKTQDGYILVDHHMRTNVPHIYAAGDLAGKRHLSSTASNQGRKIAEHAMGLASDRPHRHIDYDKAPTAIFTEPEIADVGLAEVDAFSEGKKVRVTKVPFSVSARALIQGDGRGFVKIVSDPATGVVLGGSIVGRHASELIAVLSLAVTTELTVTDLVDSMSVHPSLVEVLFEAAE